LPRAVQYVAEQARREDAERRAERVRARIRDAAHTRRAHYVLHVPMLPYALCNGNGALSRVLAPSSRSAEREAGAAPGSGDQPLASPPERQRLQARARADHRTVSDRPGSLLDTRLPSTPTLSVTRVVLRAARALGVTVRCLVLWSRVLLTDDGPPLPLPAPRFARTRLGRRGSAAGATSGTSTACRRKRRSSSSPSNGAAPDADSALSAQSVALHWNFRSRGS
jgi:hypothetical protein